MQLRDLVRGHEITTLSGVANTRYTSAFHFKLILFHDLLLRSYLYHCVWSVITAHNLTPEKRDNNYSSAASTACSLQAPTRCGVPVAQRTTAFAAGGVWHRCAANRYVQELHTGPVHKFGMERRVRKFGTWARSELGIGHDVRRAFRTWGIRTWRRNRAVKTNRLVCVSLTGTSTLKR